MGSGWRGVYKEDERQTNEKRWRDGEMRGVCGEKPARKTRGKQGEIES